MNQDFFPLGGLYIKEPDQNMDVIIFDKAPNLKTEDLKNGISRFGGRWRSPSYLHAYYRSTCILLNEGNRENCLDDIGLPLFYLQRHTTELLLKKLLSWFCDIDAYNKPIQLQDQKKRLNNEHRLPRLYEDIQISANKLGFEKPPDELNELVTLLVKYETTNPTWSRYSKTTKGDDSLPEEVAIPIQQIQSIMETVISKTLYTDMPEVTYENLLYDAWFSLAKKNGDVG